jgi:(1->4)-alpha-D-glucan 1-alpha-D-glucosylmutase
MTPRATYRLQLHNEFTFDDAAKVVPYLAELGVSHVYLSPVLMARPGSRHGYDIVDHTRLNPELGGEAAYDRLCAELRLHGMSQIIDIVPNHMGVTGADNPAWLDLLEWGRDSEYAGWFDVDWTSAGACKVLVPVLASQPGEALRNREIALRYDRHEGSFAFWCYDTHKLPVVPTSYDALLPHDGGTLDRLAESFASIGRSAQDRRYTMTLKRQLAALPDHAHETIETHLASMQVVDGQPPSALITLLAAQNWRVAHFRVAGDDINYRRFFNINELAGLRIEWPEVHEKTHERVMDLVRRGDVTGLRIDHIDGLADPAGYLNRLRENAGPQVYIVVEKILAAHEALPAGWDVAGTTGYDFAATITRFLIDPEGAESLARIHAGFTRTQETFEDLAYRSKLELLESEMASELQRLARLAASIASTSPFTCDFTQPLLRRAISVLMACFPVYRTYIDPPGRISDQDRKSIEWAFGLARKRAIRIDQSVFGFLKSLLLVEMDTSDIPAQARADVHAFIRLFQQYTGPVTAKGIEDTAFYRHTRLLALNEVGADPAAAPISAAALHADFSSRAGKAPHSMLATATHDTKRGEDARARLAALSDHTGEWAKAVRTWHSILRARLGNIERDAPPSRNDEYMLYQLLVSTWPVELLDSASDNDALSAYGDRLEQCLVKSLREAKTTTSWINPDTEYEAAVVRYARSCIDAGQPPAFFENFLPFAKMIAEAGAQRTVLQTVLKLTAPGVPDIYQGCELWDLSFVDPDNRRSVDYAAREAVLSSSQTPAEAFREWTSGGSKVQLIRTLLDQRKATPELFASGSYEPLPSPSEHYFGFMRRHGSEAVTVWLRKGAPEDKGPALRLRLHAADCRDLLSDTRATQDGIAAAQLGTFPAAVLVS